jgi:hypothetical protein
MATPAPALPPVPDAVAQGPRLSWDRGDGFDTRDPSAPPVWRCYGCDLMLGYQTAYCPSCEEEVTCWLDDGKNGCFAEVEAYWRNPAPFEAERDAMRDTFNAAMAPHDKRVRAQMEALWAGEARS